jgi:hypothetical protein
MIWKAAVIIALMLSILEAKPTWRRIVIDPSITLRRVVFVNCSEGWICASAIRDTGLVLHASDG